MQSCEVIYYISTFISARESQVIRRTKLKDIQACSRVSRRNSDDQTCTDSLSTPGLADYSAWKAFHARIYTHTPVLAYIFTDGDSSDIKMQKQLNASHNSA